MPAPQASQMQNFARMKFTSFQIRVPTDWQEPQGEDADHYSQAFKPEEKTTAPGTPPLFVAASSNKYHTDTQKMLIDKFGSFIDDTCSAICSAWSQWQTAASMAGILINGPTASLGQLIGPPLMPLIMLTAPKASPMQMKYSSTIANVISTAWLAFTATVKIPGLPCYPQFAAWPAPVAPPQPNVPFPFAALTQVPMSIMPMTMKSQMVGMLADPMAPFHAELFESICDAFDKCYNIWKGATQVTNILGGGAVPTCIPPVMPPGPVVAGIGVMAPGGLV